MTDSRPLLAGTAIFGRVVVGVDHRAGGREALVLAELLQGVCGAELAAVYVYLFDRTVRLHEADEVEAGRYEELLAELEQELTRAGVAARPVVVADPSPPTHFRPSPSATTPTRSWSARHTLPVPSACSGATRRPRPSKGRPVAVAVAPAGFAGREPVVRTVGVGFDGSAEARAALALAGQLARTAGAALHVVTVGSESVAEHEAAATAEGGTYEVVESRPATELARRSADLDLLIVGSRGPGPVRRFLLSSTSSRLVREASCPVLIVPRRAPP